MTVVPVTLPEQKLTFTQWFHGDCIAARYGVEIYAKEHWALLDKYMRMAAEHGMNMILTPVFTPALDTEIGKERPCTQLVEITKNDAGYHFDFPLLHTVGCKMCAEYLRYRKRRTQAEIRLAYCGNRPGIRGIIACAAAAAAYIL